MHSPPHSSMTLEELLALADNGVNLRFCHLWKHRQGKQLACIGRSPRKLSFVVSHFFLVAAQFMDRNWVVNACSDASIIQELEACLSFLCANSVDVPDWNSVGRRLWQHE